LATKPTIALGGIVPNLLRAPKAIPYQRVLESLWETRAAFTSKQLHVFGIGGTATLHLAALMGFNSLDSSGWRNRAARGIVQLPGKGDRALAELGSWRGRQPSESELGLLERCCCPACRHQGLNGLKAPGITGFNNRATHNLWVLLEEAEWITRQLRRGTYEHEFRQRLDNTIYLPLIQQVLSERLDRLRAFPS
jgi:queuine/archaeosine tRNA-ribosyltransferase